MLLGVKAVQTHQTLSFYRMSWICALDDDIPILLAHTKQYHGWHRLYVYRLYVYSFVVAYVMYQLMFMTPPMTGETNHRKRHDESLQFDSVVWITTYICKFLGPFGHRSSRVSKLTQWAMGIFCCKHLFESEYKLIPQIWLLLRCIEVPCSCVGKSWYYGITVAVGTILIHFICILN